MDLSPKIVVHCTSEGQDSRCDMFQIGFTGSIYDLELNHTPNEILGTPLLSYVRVVSACDFA